MARRADNAPVRISYQSAGDPNVSLPPTGRGSSRREPRRWRRLGVIACVALLATTTLLGLGVIAGRAWAEMAIAEQLKAQASARGWSAEWSAMHLGFDLTLQLRGLEANNAKGSSLHLTSAQASWTLADLLRGRFAPDTVQAEGLVAQLDVAALRGGTAATSGSPQAPSDAPGKGLLRQLKQQLDRSQVSLKRGTVHLRNLPGDMDSIEMQGVELTGTPQEPGSWSAVWSALCTQGCGDVQLVKGQIERSPDLWRGTLGLEEALTLDLPPEKIGMELSARIQRLSAELRRGELSVGAREVTIPVASDEVRGTLTVDSVMVSHPDDKKLRTVTLQRPRFEGYRPAAAERSDYDDEHSRIDLIEPEEQQPSIPSIPTPLSIRETIAKIVPRLGSIRVQDGELHLTRMDIHLTEIEAEPRGDAYRVGGALGGGRIAVEAQAQAPHVILELEKMPMQPFASRYIPRIGDRIGGLVSGQVRIDLDQPTPKHAGVFRADGRLVVEDGTFEHPKITPVGLVQEQLGVEFTGSYRPLFGEQDDRLEIKSLALDFPSRVQGRTARVNIAGDIENLFGSYRSKDEKLRWNSRFWLDETPCDIAIGAIPRGMVPHLWDQIKATGSFAPSVTLNIDLADPYGLEFDIQGLPGSCKIQSLGDYSPRYLNEPFRQEVREGVTRRGIYVGPTSGHYARLWQIPRHVAASMYITEESAFYSNPGFSVSLMRRAIRLNFDRMRYVYGGSSIEQQLVKNLFMTRQKTLSRKLEEAFIVWRMGDVVTKDRIIELYMNCIEFGPNLYGIVKASWFYFGKPPHQLTPLEGVFLAAIKPSPLNGVGVKKVGHTPTGGWWHKRISNTMRKLYERRFISREQYMDAYPFVLYFPGHKPSEELTSEAEETLAP
ncbi:MAG: hypothetical protein CMH57_14015 [Myxococcales bacterium]|nr:hypothetical protein [Myxococcales bacterium]